MEVTERAMNVLEENQLLVNRVSDCRGSRRYNDDIRGNSRECNLNGPK
jgi:hypothetical protein